jgi:hypothetical protein
MRGQSLSKLAGRRAVPQQARRGGQWIKESQQAVNMMRPSCHRFRSNEVRLWLSVLAYSPGQSRSTGRRLMKTGGRLIKHARYYRLLLAESHPTLRPFWRYAAANRDATGLDH